MFWNRNVGKGQSVVDQGRCPGRAGQEPCSGPPACSGEGACGLEQPPCHSGPCSHLRPCALRSCVPSLGSRALLGVGWNSTGGETCHMFLSSSLSLSPSLCLPSQRQACHLTISGSEEDYHWTSICLGELMSTADTAQPGLETPVAPGGDHCVLQRAEESGKWYQGLQNLGPLREFKTSAHPAHTG